jgi:hypothetical protein
LLDFEASHHSKSVFALARRYRAAVELARLFVEEILLAAVSHPLDMLRGSAEGQRCTAHVLGESGDHRVRLAWASGPSSAIARQIEYG